MGRNNNIKRAKRLKEAKRKRELEALISSGNGPGAEEIRKRSESKGGLVLPNDTKIKYSELLKSFVYPLLESQDKIDIIKTKYTIGATIWNAALMREKSEEAFQLSRKKFISGIPEWPEFELLFDTMVKRKQEEFAEYKNIIVDFEIIQMRGLDYELSVATSTMNEQ